MKDLDDIFGHIEDLPISEETLGAYLEGNLLAQEEAEVVKLIDSNPQLSSLVEENQMSEGFYDFEEMDFPYDSYASLQVPGMEAHLFGADAAAIYQDEISAYPAADRVLEHDYYESAKDFDDFDSSASESYLDYDSNDSIDSESDDFSVFDSYSDFDF